MLKYKTISRDEKDDFDKDMNTFLAEHSAIVNIEFAVGDMTHSYRFNAFILYSDEV